MKKILLVVGQVYLGFFACVIVVCAIAILLAKGIGEFWAVFSPMNLVNWLLIGALGLPGVLLVQFGKKD
jgi:hypothetical protein